MSLRLECGLYVLGTGNGGGKFGLDWLDPLGGYCCGTACSDGFEVGCGAGKYPAGEACEPLLCENVAGGAL